MKNNPRIERLKEMMNLEEKRVAIQQQLNELMERMTELRDALLTDSEDTEPTPTRGPSKAPTRLPKGPAQRGALKDRIMTALEAAGAQGVRVKELAQALGTKPVNVHSWFHSSIKRYPAIKKIEGGHYRLEGSVSEKQSAPSRGAAKGGRKKTTRGKRGELTTRILGVLKDAGSEGISVKEIAEKLGANYRNIYIWFATTGKKNSAIKKVGPAHYRLAS
jgi:hypothetical protein